MKPTDKNAPAFTSQLPLPLPESAPRYEREAFILTASNKSAVHTVEAWRVSEEHAIIICGPVASGKTHLANIVAKEMGGLFLSLSERNRQESAAGPFVFDNLPSDDPKNFLAALEDLAAAGRRVILVGTGHPRDWSGDLKDLRTRLEAMPRATLGEPDEALIEGVVMQAFKDRQLDVSPKVVKYAVPRLSRTFVAARAFVSMTDRLALQEKREITVPLAQKIIDNLSEGDLSE